MIPGRQRMKHWHCTTVYIGNDCIIYILKFEKVFLVKTKSITGALALYFILRARSPKIFVPSTKTWCNFWKESYFLPSFHFMKTTTVQLYCWSRLLAETHNF